MVEGNPGLPEGSQPEQLESSPATQSRSKNFELGFIGLADPRWTWSQKHGTMLRESPTKQQKAILYLILSGIGRGQDRGHADGSEPVLQLEVIDPVLPFSKTPSTTIFLHINTN